MNELAVIRGIHLDAVRIYQTSGKQLDCQWRIILPIEGHTYLIGIYVYGVLDIL